MRCALGVYGDNKPENTNRFDAMNGAPCAWIMGTIMDTRPGWANVRWLWDDQYLGKNLKVDWLGRPLPFKRWINFSIAIFPKDGSVEAAARNEYVKEWTNQATQLRDGAPAMTAARSACVAIGRAISGSTGNGRTPSASRSSIPGAAGTRPTRRWLPASSSTSGARTMLPAG
ncbi:hypothetical protein [Teichococcus aestuarii]|uniref:hypothetical protein n=1 Tax=Teichococcus aestuarii TaxID=568898 RepID=UPI00360CF323